MFIRFTTQKNKNGEIYGTHRLVESYRNAQGKVRQQTLLNLGSSFDFPKEQWKILADRVEEIMKGQNRLFDLDVLLEKEAQRIAKLVISQLSDIVVAKNQSAPVATHDNTTSEAASILRENASGVAVDYQTVDINSLQHRDIRKIGAEYVGLHAAQQLKLERILLEIGFNQKQVHIALANIIGRLVQPGSERSTHRYLSEHSALDELLNTDFSDLSLKNFYKIADLLYKNKEKIEKSLYHREKDLFNLEETISLYDITNTYFEGRCLANPKAQYGRSKEKRTDCPLVALGMILDGSGFPKKSDIFPGNIGEPKTLQKIIESLGDNKKAIIVMDAGFATEENLNWMRETQRKYIVVSRKRDLVMPDDNAPIIVKQTTNNLVKVTLVDNKETNELELYCHSKAKEEKTKQMVNKFTDRFETELLKLKEGLNKKGYTKQYDKVVEKVGRLKEQYKKVGKLYEISITPDADSKNASNIVWKRLEDQTSSDKTGFYCLRTNQKNLDAKTFWETYTMLTELEAAFRNLKSELGFRPVFHQKEKRIDAHLFISVIAYHLLHTIRYQLKERGISSSWQTLRDLLDTQCRITTTLKLENGQTVQIRKSNSPDANQLQIYKALGINSHPGKTEKTYL